MQMWTKDGNVFDRWMKASAVVGSIFAAAVVIMAVSSSKAPGPEQAAAGGTPGTRSAHPQGTASRRTRYPPTS